MALDMRLAHVLMEIEGAEKDRDDKLSQWKTQKERYHGPAYKGNYDQGRVPAKENHYHDWNSLIVPMIAFDNPRCRVASFEHHEQAQAFQHGINQWIKDNTLRNLLARGPAVDMQFNWSILMCCLEPTGTRPIDYWDPSKKEKRRGVPYSPKGYRIPQTRYLEDPGANNEDELRWRGHEVVADKDDIERWAQADPDTWNLDVVKHLCLDDREERINTEKLEATGIDRNLASYYEIWCPEYQPDKSKGPKQGYHGAILTVARTGADGLDENYKDHVRPPRPFFGPPWGPYTKFGVYNVPDETMPLGPLTVLDRQIEDLNIHDNVLSRSAADYKKLILVDSEDPETAEKIKDKEHHNVVLIKGLADKAGQTVVEVELGGITDQMLGYRAVARERLDRHSAINDAKRGNAQGGSTATENEIANASANARLAWVDQQFTDGVIRFLRSVLWYMAMEGRVQFPLGAKAAEEMGWGVEPKVDDDGFPVIDRETGEPVLMAPQPWFEGGREDEEFSADEFVKSLEIEPYSMRRTDDAAQQARLMSGIQLAMQLAPMARQFPEWDWKQFVNDIGQALNWPDYGDRFNAEAAQMLAGLEMQAQLHPPDQRGREPKIAQAKGQSPTPSSRLSVGRNGTSSPGAPPQLATASGSPLAPKEGKSNA